MININTSMNTSPDGGIYHIKTSFLAYTLPVTLTTMPQSLYAMAHLWDLGSKVLVLPRVLQEVDKLQNLQFGLLTARNVLESNADVVFNYLGFGFTHAEGVNSPPTSTTSCHWSLTGGEK